MRLEVYKFILLNLNHLSYVFNMDNMYKHFIINLCQVVLQMNCLFIRELSNETLAYRP